MTPVVQFLVFISENTFILEGYFLINISKHIHAVGHVQHMGPTSTQNSRKSTYERVFYLILFHSYFCVSIIRNCLRSFRRCSKWVPSVCIILRTRGIFERWRNSLIRWLQGCIQIEGSHFEHVFTKVNSCGLPRHKNGCNFETRSDRTYLRMNLSRCLLSSPKADPTCYDTPGMCNHRLQSSR